jgi:hypothetical protein
MAEKRDGPKSVEFYDSRERDSKAKWHYANAGKRPGATLSKAISNDYQSELVRKEADPHKQQPMNHTKLLNVGDKDDNVKTGLGVHAANGFAFRD